MRTEGHYYRKPRRVWTDRHRIMRRNIQIDFIVVGYVNSFIPYTINKYTIAF